MTQQSLFGGHWTQLKLEILRKYLNAYRKIFQRNPRAQFFQPIYVDAFAGTGTIPRQEVQSALVELVPSLLELEEEFKKGSARRALEVDPPFNHYLFIEKDAAKCEELSALREVFPGRDIEVLKDDANTALLRWCTRMDAKRQRAVVFIDPFGAALEWAAIEALATTRAVDLWVLFPYSAINRMLTRDQKPSPSWSDKLTRVFGTPTWESRFYSSSSETSLLGPDIEIELVRKIAGPNMIIDFYAERLRTVFPEVARPGLLFNSRSLLFVLYFAASNKTGVKIANDLLRDISK